MLCDTGACMTVLRDAPLNVSYSRDARIVTSASGHTTAKPLTNKLEFLHVERNRSCKMQCIVDPSCPVNLLGRDGLTKLKIGVVPECDGMRAEIMLSRADAYVCHGEGEPHYYWTLDLPPCEKVINLAARYLPQISQKMAPNMLHNTLRYKQTPGPDLPYDAQIHKLGPQCLTLQHLYVTKSGNAVCSVIQPPTSRALNRMPNAHVSIAKNLSAEWKDLGTILSRVQNDHYEKTEDTHEGWLQSRRTGCMRYTLGWTLITTPSTHLDMPTAHYCLTEDSY